MVARTRGQVLRWCRAYGPAEARRRMGLALPSWPADAIAAGIAALDECEAEARRAPEPVAESPARDVLRRLLGRGGAAL